LAAFSRFGRRSMDVFIGKLRFHLQFFVVVPHHFRSKEVWHWDNSHFSWLPAGKM